MADVCLFILTETTVIRIKKTVISNNMTNKIISISPPEHRNIFSSELYSSPPQKASLTNPPSDVTITSVNL